MRYTAVVLLMIVAACSVQQELAPTPPQPAGPSTTDALPPTTLADLTTTTTDQPTTTTTLEAPKPDTSVAYEEVAHLSFPIQLTALPGSKISYIATKDGRIWLYDGVAISDEP